MFKRKDGQAPGAISRVLPWAVIFLTLTILGIAIYLLGQQLREEIRNQIVGRDGSILHAVALMQQYEEADIDFFAPIEEPATQFDILLKTSRLRGVIAARLFDADGEFISAFPLNVTDGEVLDPDLRSLQQLAPASQYHRRANLDDFFYLYPHDAETESSVPLLEVNIPIHRKEGDQLLGIAQFIIDGEDIAQEFASLDRHLFTQAGITFLTGSFLILLTLGWGFHRLQKSNQLLARRSEDLLRANQELVLSAKTSAVGSVAAYLVHGLKNPLFGLQNLVNERAAGNSSEDEEGEWQAAALTTRRMQTLVNEVVHVLQDEDHVTAYEISFEELLDILCAKVLPLAEEAHIHFEKQLEVNGRLHNRAANLVILILQNLIHNAIQACPRGGKVKLVLAPAESAVVCEVHDEGPGISEEVRKNLFSPCRSTKKNGSGIGLAISKQMASHMGASLNLQTSTPNGSIFTVTIPQNLILDENKEIVKEGKASGQFEI